MGDVYTLDGKENNKISAVTNFDVVDWMWFTLFSVSLGTPHFIRADFGKILGNWQHFSTF